MSVTEIEKAITELPTQDVQSLMTWIADHHAKLWDAQIEDDLEAGRLDTLLAEVDHEIDLGMAKPL